MGPKNNLIDHPSNGREPNTRKQRIKAGDWCLRVGPNITNCDHHRPHGPPIPCGPTCKTNKKRCRGKPSHPSSPLRLALATALSIKMRAAWAQWVLLLMLSRSDTRDSGPTCIRPICLAGLHSSL